MLTCKASVCDVEHEARLSAILFVFLVLVHLVPRFFLSVQLALRRVLRLRLMMRSCYGLLNRS